MHKIASLYGIGLHLNRTPGFDSNSECMRGYTKEFLDTFPNMMKLTEFHDLNNSDVTYSNFGTHDYKYDDPKILHNIPEKYLVLHGFLFQSYKYFHYVKKEIRELFDFHPKIKDTVEKYGMQLFGNDTESHKMCVHIRRGDFISHRTLETKADFLIPAMDTVRNFVSKKYPGKKISLVFLTTDWDFVDSLNFPKSDYLNIYRPQLNARAEDMYFGVRYCQSFLLSSSASTFGFWMAYLMPDGSPIFYNGQSGKDKVKDFLKSFVDYDIYPKEWNILQHDKKGNIVTIDNRWFFEKISYDQFLKNQNYIHL